MTSVRALLLFCAAALAAPLAFGQGPLPADRPLTQIVMDTWGRADGLPQLTVTSLAQTPDGFLWTGTQEGLAKFDGVRFRTYDAISGDLPSAAVTSLLVGRDGALWVGTRSGVARLSGGAFETVGGATEDAFIFALARGPNGAVWAGTRGGAVARFEGGRFEAVTGLDSLGAPVTALAAVGESLWIGTLGRGLWRWADGRLRPVASGTLGEAHVTALSAGPDGLAIGTLGGDVQGGLFHIRRNRIRRDAADVGAGVRTLHRDPLGTLWAGTEQGGLVRLARGTTSALTEEGGLPHPTVRSLITDQEGSLWIGTEGGGLVRARPGKVVTWGTPEGLASDVAFSIAEDASGAVWVATEGGGISRIQNGAVTTLTTADGLPGDVALALAPARGSSGAGASGAAPGVWVGFYGDGLALVQGGRVTQRYGPDALPDASVFGLHTDDDGTAWAATSAGLVRVRGGAVTAFTQGDGLSSDVTTAIARDARGRLLVGTYEAGLTVLETTASGVRVVRTIRQADGLGSEAVISLLAMPDGTVWIGTEGGGLSRMAPDGSVVTVRARDGLPSDNILHALPDGRGNLWLSTNRGLVVVREAAVDAFARGESARVPTVVYNEADGLRTQEFNGGVSPAGWKARDGSLWFAGASGAVQVPAGPVRLNTVAPPVAITRVRANGKAVALGGVLGLQPGLKRLSIDYTALSFIGSGQLQFRYRLDGVDDSWVRAGTVREADYTNLAPGNYTFHVEAANADGLWSDAPATVAFNLAPSLTQTVWFRALALLATLGLLALAYGFRVRGLKRRQERLEQLVAERTRTIETEKARAEEARNRAEAAWAQGEIDRETIQEQAADLETANESLREVNEQLAETSEVKSHLMRVVAHDLNNPLGVVIGYAEELREETDGEAHELIDVIDRAAGEMLALVKRFLGAEAVDAGRLAMASESVDLSALGAHVVDRYRPTVRKKEQSLRFASGGPAWVIGDRDWLKEVVDNLVSNAVKYTPPGRAIRVDVVQAHGLAQIRVRDQGPGLTADDQAKLFGRFQRLSAQPTGGESSTGLGLSIVKKVVEMHNGRVWAESEVGVGSTFVVELDSIPPSGDGAQHRQAPALAEG